MPAPLERPIVIGVGEISVVKITPPDGPPENDPFYSQPQLLEALLQAAGSDGVILQALANFQATGTAADTIARRRMKGTKACVVFVPLSSRPAAIRQEQFQPVLETDTDSRASAAPGWSLQQLPIAGEKRLCLQCTVPSVDNEGHQDILVIAIDGPPTLVALVTAENNNEALDKALKRVASQAQAAIDWILNPAFAVAAQQA